MVYGFNVVLGVDVNNFILYDDDIEIYWISGYEEEFEKKKEAIGFIIQKVEESSLGIETFCTYEDGEEAICIIGIPIMGAGFDDVYDYVKMDNFLKYKKQIGDDLHKFFNCNYDIKSDIDIHYVGYH